MQYPDKLSVFTANNEVSRDVVLHTWIKDSEDIYYTFVRGGVVRGRYDELVSDHNRYRILLIQRQRAYIDRAEKKLAALKAELDYLFDLKIEE